MTCEHECILNLPTSGLRRYCPYFVSSCSIRFHFIVDELFLGRKSDEQLMQVKRVLAIDSRTFLDSDSPTAPSAIFIAGELSLGLEARSETWHHSCRYWIAWLASEHCPCSLFWSFVSMVLGRARLEVPLIGFVIGKTFPVYPVPPSSRYKPCYRI